VTELDASIALLKPEADRVPNLETEKTTLLDEREKLNVWSFCFMLTVDSSW
jgi:hypothetical protein